MSAPSFSELGGRRVTPTAIQLLSADAPRERWLEVRRSGIGSSDVAAALGLVKKRTRLHVYYNKIGDLPEEEDNEQMLWGRLNEPTIAAEWTRRNKTVTRRVGVVAHYDHPWMLATLDRRVTECPLRKSRRQGLREACALEIKNRSAFVADRWKGRNIPDDVLAQLAWQRLVTGYDHIHYGVLIGGCDYRQGVYFKDDEVESYVYDEVECLYFQHIVPRIPPPGSLEQAEAEADLYDKLYPEVTGELELDGIDAVFDLAATSAAYREAKKDYDRARAQIRLLAGSKQYLTFAGQLAVTLRPATKTNVKASALAELYPEAFADPDVVSTTDYHQIVLADPYKQQRS